MLTEVHVPHDSADAIELVAGGATAMGGGTVLMPRLIGHSSAPTEVVSLRMAGLAGIGVDGSTVRLGAAATLADVERDERLQLLWPVVRSIASVPVRGLATVAGNIFARQPYGDLAVALVALGATATIAGTDGTRQVPVQSLVGPGGDPPGLVVHVAVDLPADGSFRYLKAARRRYNSASIVTVAALLDESDGQVRSASVALGGVGPQVVRAGAIESELIGRPLDEKTVAAAARAGLAEISPSDDAYASAWYRNRVFGVHLRRALLGH